ncbi:MAG: UDP-N-acetylglucosamine 1-carboxyvinyltransferase [bacterium]|nr:UDP-N-acetylglucosamine 1-carboxyvinyltransferase [bacterium]
MEQKEAFIVKGFGGSRQLSGEICVKGAKNEALKVFAASLLFKDAVRIERIPDIEDIRRMVELLESIGADVKRESHDTYIVRAGGDINTSLPRALSQQFRASVILAGPLLARFGHARFYSPGGCHIGTRPIDLLLDGLGELGVSVSYEFDEERMCYDLVVGEAGLVGADIVLRVSSVGATELLMMTATQAKGTTTIYNAAMEPEIVALALYLNSCGAKITGVGTPMITIEGSGTLSSRGKTCTIIPDRIEAGTFVLLGALSGREIHITDCNPLHLRVPLEFLRTVGVPLEYHSDRIVVRSPGREFSSNLLLKTHEYPGFPTDLQPLMVLFFTQVHGVNSVFETIYESRFEYLDDLRAMGADIDLSANHAVISGPTPLCAKEMPAMDLRAGMAFVLAAIIADGQSVVHNVYNIGRGYEAIDERLRAIGVEIEHRVS